MQVKKNRNGSFNGVEGSFGAEYDNNDSGLSQDSEAGSRMHVSLMSSAPVSTDIVKL